MEAVLKWIGCEHIVKCGVAPNLSAWKLIEVPTPQQEGGIDCGIFVAMVADRVTNGLPLNFSMDDVRSFRIKIGTDILRGSFNII